MSLLKVFHHPRPAAEAGTVVALKDIGGKPATRIAKPADETKSASFMLIDQGANVNGQINSDGDVVIEGSFKGDIVARNLTVCTTGRVNGKVHAQSAQISGEVRSELICSGLLSVQANGRLYGKIVYKDLMVEPDGKCLGEMLEYQPEGEEGSIQPSRLDGVK